MIDAFASEALRSFTRLPLNRGTEGGFPFIFYFMNHIN